MTALTRVLASLVIAVSCTTAWAEVEMKIVTPKGFVAFTVGDSWAVQSMQSHMPVAAAVFQIPHAADEGTPDSTNLIVTLYQLDSREGREKFELPIEQYGAVAPKSESFDDWTIYRQDAKQGETVYSIWDAKRPIVADVAVSVRLAWPHLGADSKSYATEMESLFRGFLKAIRGNLGPYVPAAGEVIRRPEQ